MNNLALLNQTTQTMSSRDKRNFVTNAMTMFAVISTILTRPTFRWASPSWGGITLTQVQVHNSTVNFYSQKNSPLT